MPKPLLLRRPSGLYVRYWVPLMLRAAVGSNYIVRSLGGLRGDAARLEAARLGYDLAHRFARMKNQMKHGAPAISSATLGERIAVYLKSRPSAGRYLRLFLAWVGDKPLAELSAADVNAFAETMQHCPRDAGPRKKWSSGRSAPRQSRLAWKRGSATCPRCAFLRMD
ncbi:hypothetical protein [Dyella sp.]|uniref:DUF6538 domain-containing protein n=1 Tax=Dyella sp. TaxID=1869338 RepID=UPI002FD954E3